MIGNHLRGSVVKNLPAMPETCVQSLDQEDTLEKERTTHSSILAWEIPWTEELGSYSPWGHKQLDTTTPHKILHTKYSKGSIIIMSLFTL